MVRTILMCCALFGSQGAGGEKAAAPSASDLAGYDAVQSKAGRDAESQVRLALWCEAHGLTAERLKHLSLAVLYDPANTLARGLMGLVAYQGKWDLPDAVGREIQDNPTHHALVREYLERRARTPEKGDAQMKLAAWCDEKGLKEQALAHYTAVTRLDPSREAAWRHLGYKKQGNRWVKPDELAAAKQEAARQKQADKHWKTRLEKLRDSLESKDAARHAKAEQALTEVTDPRAVPMIWALFVRGSERHQIAAVRMLGQIDGPSASNGLAVLAVFSPSGEVRRRATETLSRRDPRDIIGKLIALIRKPYKFKVRHINGPGSPGELVVEGERFDVQRVYQNLIAPMALAWGRVFTPDVPFDPFSFRNLAMAAQGAAYAGYDGRSTSVNPLGAGGMAANTPVSMPVPNQFGGPAQVNVADARAQNAAAILNQFAANPLHGATTQAHGNKGATSLPGQIAGTFSPPMYSPEAQAAREDINIGLELEAIRQANQDLERRLALDVQFLESANSVIELCNDRVLPMLQAITGQDLGVEPEKWKSWWVDQLGYSYQSDLPATKPVYTDLVTDAVPISYLSVSFPTAHSCFGAGTRVQTIDGPLPIESIRVGDQVLAQGTSTGQLAFQPVTATHHNPPAATFRIAIGGESIVATGIHRFWKAGKGWTMARELKAGDHLRMVGGTVTIESIEADKTQPVYNLEVAQDRDFFVGSKGLLVHDFSFVQPVAEPFDRGPELDAPAALSK
jgi:tetratricopeptide (TPR) repeat protein